MKTVYAIIGKYYNSDNDVIYEKLNSICTTFNTAVEHMYRTIIYNEENYCIESVNITECTIDIFGIDKQTVVREHEFINYWIDERDIYNITGRGVVYVVHNRHIMMANELSNKLKNAIIMINGKFICFGGLETFAKNGPVRYGETIGILDRKDYNFYKHEWGELNGYADKK